MAKKVQTTTISLTVDHVHMPIDLLDSDWVSATETKRYPGKEDGRRLKYEVHAGLAEFLIGRDQAIEVPALGKVDQEGRA
jgi:hypothetical protein